MNLEVLKPDERDILLYAGIGLLAWGLWQIYPPVSYIAVGLAFGYLSLWHGRPTSTGE